MTLPRLTYFSSRGRAELIRILLADAGIEHEEVTVGSWDPVTLPEPFLALRATGALAFGALPMWEEPGGFRLVQGDAILRHLARTHGWYGEGRYQAARCDQLLAGIDDVRLELRRLRTAAVPARAAVRADLLATVLPRWLAGLEQLFAADGVGESFAVGTRPSIADGALWYLLETLDDNGLGSAVAGCPRLVAFAAHHGARPGLAAYRTSAGRYPPQPLPV